MALITEDGSAKADAESFATVAFADTYHSNRGNTAWAALASTAIKEAALRKATDYMAQQYARRWLGHRTTSTQALEWPRAWVPLPSDPFDNYYASDVMPAPVKSACAELALRAAAGDLTDDEAQPIAAVSAGSVSVTFQPGSSGRKRYPAVDGLLAQLLTPSTGVTIVRV